MSDDTTLAGFLGLDEPAQVEASAKALQRSPELSRSRATPRALHAAAADAMVQAAKTMLKSPIADVIGDGWSKWRDLQQIASAAPDEVHEVTLHEHDIALSRKPSMALLVDGAPTGLQLEFELKLALTISGAVLKVQGGHITAADLGKLRGGGSLNCGGVTLVKRETSPVKLPGKLNFNPGIAIRS